MSLETLITSTNIASTVKTPKYYKKYLTKTEIEAFFGETIIPEGFKLMSQDSYCEEKIVEKVVNTGHQEELYKATLNIAIVGIGNKRYGCFESKGQVVDIYNLLLSLGVKTKLVPSSVLADDDLTVGRLCRLYRHKIRDYIRISKQTSYMYRKYSIMNPEFAHICFRGAEYLEDLSAEEEDFLQQTIMRMDTTLKTNMIERFTRVRAAIKGLNFQLVDN